MSTASINELRESLRLGLSVFSPVWDYKVKSWVTGVYALDIDNDGDVEIIACSRDGRVYILTKWGDRRWERVIGTKQWLRPIIGIPPIEGRNNQVRIITGTRDGKIYALDKDGNTIGKDGTIFPFGDDGRALAREQEVAAHWLDTGYVICQVHVNAAYPSQVVLGSEDNHAYAFDCESGGMRWKFLTKGWVRAVFSYDLDEDGAAETLVGSADTYLYVLNGEGECIDKRSMLYPVYAIFAADIDRDGATEILVATGGKDLIALTADLHEKWRSTFDNRLMSLYVADVDNDGQDEIIAAGEDKHIYILNAQGKALWRHNLKYRVLSVYATDFDNDGHVELLAGSEEEKIHVFRVQLIQDLDERIDKCYQELGKLDPVTLTDLTVDERDLLQDILKQEIQKHLMLRYVTLKNIKHLMERKSYKDALRDLIKLRNQKVQLLWRRDKTKQVGHIRTLSIRHTTDETKQEIVVGTDKGEIQVFNPRGILQRSHSLESQIAMDQAALTWCQLHAVLDHSLEGRIAMVWTGDTNSSKSAETVACSPEYQACFISGIQKQEQCCLAVDEHTTYYHVISNSRKESAELLIGSEDKKIYIYEGNLQTPISTITTPEAIKLVCAYPTRRDDALEIVAASVKDSVYAYRRSGKQMWTYETHDRIQALCIKDIDGDGEVEVLIGSYDRNVHVLNSKGHLKWRYYLPHSALAVDAVDIDHDGSIEVLVGCADGWMYLATWETCCGHTRPVIVSLLCVRRILMVMVM